MPLAPPHDTQAAPAVARPNQFALLRQRRFAPFFWTLFGGAANDNLFKFAFTVMVTYQWQVSWLPPELAGLVIGAVFILPFLLFSATAGQLTDKYEKTRLIRWVKNLEIVVMLLATLGFYAGHAGLLLCCVFLMGLHSSLFGPVKYALLPQVLQPRELTGGNGIVEMGTFVAILLGNVAGGLLAANPHTGTSQVGLACLLLALAGRVAAQAIPEAAAPDPQLRMRWNPFAETWRNLQLVRTQPLLFRSLLGISWMWFFGAVFLSQFTSYAKDVLHGDAHVASLLLVVFSLGVGTGSLLCERLSRQQVEIGLVPLGALGMSLFVIDLCVASRGLPARALMDVSGFLAQPAHWRVLFDLFMLSLSAGLYSVPIYALIQWRSPAASRARVIAANNILNALFMVVSAVLAGALLSAGLGIVDVFMCLGLANALGTACLFWWEPEYLLRALAWLQANGRCRLHLHGQAELPDEGAALLVCAPRNAGDALLLVAASPRPLVFMMDPHLLDTPVLGRLLRRTRALALAPPSADAAAQARALDAAESVLAAGELLVMCTAHTPPPENGRPAWPAALAALLQRQPVPIIPLALLHGGEPPRANATSDAQRQARRGLFKPVTLHVGQRLEAQEL